MSNSPSVDVSLDFFPRCRQHDYLPCPETTILHFPIEELDIVTYVADLMMTINPISQYQNIVFTYCLETDRMVRSSRIAKSEHNQNTLYRMVD